MGKTANLELNTTEMSDKISDFVSEYNSNMNMLDDLYGDVQDDASSALSTAQSADTKATAAQTAAGNAVTTANSANSTAQSANTTAGQANTAATAAQTAASNAVTTANEAKTIAQNAAETAEGAEDAVRAQAFKPDYVGVPATKDPIKGFYVHDEATDTDGVAKVDYGSVANTPDFDAIQNGDMADLLYNVEWEQGSLSTNTGLPNSSLIRIRTKTYIPVEHCKYINTFVPSGYEWCMYAYTDIDVKANDTYYGYYSEPDLPGTANWHSENGNVLIREGVKYVKFIIRRSDDAQISPLESENFHANAPYKLLIDVDHVGNFETNTLKTAQNGYFTIAPKYWYQAIPYPISQPIPNGIMNSTTRICTDYIEIPPYAKNITITPSSNLRAAFYLYDENGTKLKDEYWSETGYSFNVESNYKYLVVGLSKSSGTITPDENDVTITCESTIDFATVSDMRLKQSIANIVELPTIDLGWEIGTLVPGSGSENTGNNRIRSRYILVGKGTKLIRTDSNLWSKHLIYMFDFDKNYLSDLAWTKSDIIVDRDCYIRVLLNKNADEVITEDEIDTIAATETIYRTFPQYLMDREIYTPPVEIPEYFENEIDTAIETAKDNIFAAGISGDSFVFISDVHWQSNTKNSPALVRKAVDALNLDKIICGGDLIGGGAKATNIDLMADCVNQFKEITRFYCLFGNHDSNTIGAPSTDDNFTKSESYALMQKQSDFVMNYGEPCYFYFDNPTTKTRYICLDTGLGGSALGADQSAWIDSTLNSTPENYHVLVFAHIIYMPTNGYHIGITKDEVYRTAFMNTVCDKLDAFNAGNQNKKVEAIFGGHMHFDADFTTTGGIPIVLIDCDTRQTFTETTPGSGVANHAAGTINEQCFDIVTVDYASSTIKCTRVGRGSDRTFTY